MSNKLAPYKDPEVMKTLTRFAGEVAPLHIRNPFFAAGTDWMLYRQYLEWIAGQDRETIASTLNQPQFDKAWQVWALMQRSN